MNFKKWVKSIQTAGYNGARMVYKCQKIKEIGFEFRNTDQSNFDKQR